MPKESPRQARLLSLIDRHPELPSRTIARMAHQRWPNTFRSVETARDYVRAIRGTRGRNVVRVKNRRPTSKKQAGGGTYPPLPDARQEVATFEPLAIEGPCTVAVLSDIHVPFHDPDSLEIALTTIATRKPSVILLNGDIVDFYEVSRFERDPELLDFPDSLAKSRQFLEHLRKRFPRCRIIYKVGNHEERWTRWLRVEAPVVYGVEEFELPSLLRLAEHRIECVTDARRITLGALTVIHGHEYRFAISNPVNPARGLFLRGKINSMCGHFHQVSHHSEKTMAGKVISTFSTGCLCNLTPQYHPYNNWGHGFAMVTVDKSGAWHVENLRIVDKKVW